jgi:hypothetical protein
MALAGCEQESQRPATAVAGEMELGGQSASGSAEGVIVRFVRPMDPVFRPVAVACWWARTTVESTWTSQSMSPAASAWAWICCRARDEHAVQRVAAEAGVHGFPGAVAFRQVAPGDPNPDLADHPVDDLPVRHSRPAGGGPRYQRSEQLPLRVGEFMAAYRSTMIHHP